jgi:dATP pyrophosphohydrolase
MPGMPQVVSDIIDVYVFRRLNARVQFLLLQRRADVAMPQTWQAFHSLIDDRESTIDAVRRAVKELSGLNISAIYSADYVNQFYDESRDVLVLAPVFAVNVSPQAPVELGDDFRDCAWFDRDEATSRLPFSGQRWATRHIDEIMSLGEAEAEIYRLELPIPSTPSPLSVSPDHNVHVPPLMRRLRKKRTAPSMHRSITRNETNSNGRMTWMTSYLTPTVQRRHMSRNMPRERLQRPDSPRQNPVY